jgi:hypothetical protein
MCATTTKTRKPVTRTAHVSHLGDALILWLTVDKNTTAYRVTAIPHAYGKAAFHLQKADKGDGEPEAYDVLLDGQFSSCECKGFLRHGMSAAGGKGCKHIAGCQAAVNAGQLQAAPKPEAKPARKANPTCFECRKPYADCTCSI